jgi:hypothetical protein
MRHPTGSTPFPIFMGGAVNDATCSILAQAIRGDHATRHTGESLEFLTIAARSIA